VCDQWGDHEYKIEPFLSSLGRLDEVFETYVASLIVRES